MERSKMKTCLLIFFVLFSANVNSGWDVGLKAYSGDDNKDFLHEFELLVVRGYELSRNQVEINYESCRNYLEYIYEGGRGSFVAFSDSIYNFRKSAMQGFANVQYTVGLEYDEGENIIRELNKSVSFYFKSVQEDFATARLNIKDHMFWDINSSLDNINEQQYRALVENKTSPHT